MLFIHTSNQLEQLSSRFSFIVNSPLKDVFASEMIVVQNAGMARYLSMQVATIGGISANSEYLFPAEFMWRLLRLVSPDIPEKSQCTPETLRFHIMQELTNNPSLYPELTHYIFRDVNTSTNTDFVDESLTWELSCQLADTLDRTLFYRCEWIDKWEENPETESRKNWQARLWINCVTNKGLLHWLHLQRQFKSSFDKFDTHLLPERISFFSMSSLSPGYLELIGEIAQKTDIHVYVINPCQDQYWGDISSEKSRSKLSIEKQSYVDVGNSLLASMGVQGRDFIDQLLNISTQPEKIKPYDVDISKQERTLLIQIQQDIYNLKEPAKKPKEKHRKVGGGTSIHFNSCHTAMREVEVLHDQILDALDSDLTLMPSDILVMMPDVEDYAPYIESIFTSPINSNTSTGKRNLPFSIADRDPLNVHQLIEVLLKAFQLPDTQFNVESVFEILDYEAVHTSFNLTIDQVDQCRQLAKATNIRWGINAANRAQNKYPATHEHTWKYALDNTLLGYALGENYQSENENDGCDLLFEDSDSNQLGLLAYNEIEGSNALMLSDLKHFTDVIFRINQWQKKQQSLTNWLENLTKLIQQLFSDEQYASDLTVLFKSIDDLTGLTELTKFQNDLSFALFTKILQANLQKIEGHEKFLGHGITFCALVPMRSVPFKVIALMGMNDGEYPRQDKHSSFDAVAVKPKRGDRSRRDEDRYLFLESILAARSRLIISYTGKSVKDNSDLPPSVLVSELLDVISVYTDIEPEELICKHPLQAFSPKYFQQTSDDLFSYAKQYTSLNFGDERVRNNHLESMFIKKPLDTLDDSFKTVSIEQLIQFYQSPARFFLKARFDIKTYDENITLPTREPFKIESFKNRDIRELVMNTPCKNDADSASLSQAQQIARAKGLLPYGDIGDALYQKEKEVIDQFKNNFPETEYLSSEGFSLELTSKTAGKFILHGIVHNISSDISSNKGNNISNIKTRIVQQMTTAYCNDAIALWISHLLLNTKAPARTEFRTPEDSFTVEPVEDAEQQLTTLIEHYWKGLHFPLPFFPKSAYSMFKDKSTENLSKAAGTWNGTDYVTGEKKKFEHWLLYRDVHINSKPVESGSDINHEFITLSHQIFGEYFRHRESIN